MYRKTTEFTYSTPITWLTAGLERFTPAQTSWVLSHFIYCLFLWGLIYILLVFLKSSRVLQQSGFFFNSLWLLRIQHKYCGGDIHLKNIPQRFFLFLQILSLELLPRKSAEILLCQSVFSISLIILFTFLIKNSKINK